MSLVSVVRGRVVVTTALLVTLGAAIARAQTSDGAATPTSAPAAGATSAATPLSLWVETGGAAFDAAALQASLASELARPLTLANDAGSANVRVRLEGATHAEVRYTTPSGEQLSRRVELPPDRRRALQVVTWLTVNLVRDEAAELLDALRARRKQEAEARAAEERAAAEKAAAEKAAADKVAAERAAAEKAAAEAARKRAEQAKSAENGAAGPPSPGLLRDPLRSFDAALITPISLVKDSPKRALTMQLSLLYGEAGGIEGISFSTGALRVRRDLFGAAIGLGMAVVGGNARGVVLGGGYAHVANVLDGALIGVGAAWHRGRIARGIVAAGGGALAGDLVGLELATGFVTARSLYGMAAAGGVVAIRGPSKGFLMAGGLNISASHRGFELSGGMNTARDLDGFALAPLNIHRRVRGLQVGVVNIADQVDGAALGVVSYARNGRLQPVLWSSTDGSVHLALKSIVGWAFTQLGAGIDLRGASYSYDGGIGMHLKLFDDLFLEPGLHYSATNGTEAASGAPDAHQFHYMVQLGYRAGDKLDLLGGAGLRHTFSGGSGAPFAPELRAGIAFF